MSSQPLAERKAPPTLPRSPEAPRPRGVHLRPAKGGAALSSNALFSSGVLPRLSSTSSSSFQMNFVASGQSSIPLEIVNSLERLRPACRQVSRRCGARRNAKATNHKDKFVSVRDIATQPAIVRLSRRTLAHVPAATRSNVLLITRQTAKQDKPMSRGRRY